MYPGRSSASTPNGVRPTAPDHPPLDPAIEEPFGSLAMLQFGAG